MTFLVSPAATVLFGHFCSFVNVLRLLEFYFPDAYIPQRERKLIHEVAICIKHRSICHRLLSGWVWHPGITQLVCLSTGLPVKAKGPQWGLHLGARWELTQFTSRILTIMFLRWWWHNWPCHTHAHTQAQGQPKNHYNWWLFPTNMFIKVIMNSS